ncbi:MAG: hypothetical protein ABIR63_00480 [Sphingomicrobium sp.]
MASCVPPLKLHMLFAGLILDTSAAGATPPPPAPPPASTLTTGSNAADIVIEGKRRGALRAFVERLAEAGATDQLARWKEEICPAVAGIDPAEAAWVEDRIAASAKTVGLRRRTKCVPDLLVIIDPDAAAIAKEIASDFPRDDGMWRINRFLKSDRPVRWLTVTDECAERCELRNSRITKPTTAGFTAVLILVDAKRLAGISLGELADYVTFVGLSNPRQAAKNPSNSILSLFDSAPVPGAPLAMTNRDKSFLAGLYRTQMNASAASQKSAIANAIREAEEEGKRQK